MKTKLLIPVVAICLATLSPVSAADSVTEVFQKALFEEEANQNYDAAMRAYREVVAQMDQQRKLAATAVFRLGECYRKLGQTNEAVAQYQRIVRDFPDQPTLVNLSRQNLAGLEAAAATAGLGASAGAISGTGPESQRVRLIERQLAEAQSEYGQSHALVAQLEKLTRAELANALPTILPDQNLATLLEQQSLQALKLKDFAVLLSPNHPDVQRLNAVLEEIERQIQERVDGIMAGLRLKESVAESQVIQLKKELEQAAVVEPRASPALSQAARLEQKRLLEEAIKLAEKQLASTKQQVETGRAPSNDLIAREREILALRLQLAGLDLRWTGTASPAGTAEAGATDEEDKEVRRIQAMIKNSPDLINEPGPDKLTPLQAAARKGQLVVARFLLENKADPKIRRESSSQVPLTEAAANGHKAMVELLLAKGVDANADDGSALRIASEKRFRSVVETLLAAKANPNAPDYRGDTALHLAVRFHSLAIAELLIKSGSDVNAVNRIGKPSDDPGRVAVRQADGTPLHIAASQGDVAMMSLLLSNRADVSLVNFLGETPLHVSASQLPIVTNLLAAGADVNRVVADGPFKGWTPLLYAVSWNGTNAAKALLQAGADPNVYAATILTPPEEQRPNYAKKGGRVGYTPLLMAVTKLQPEMVNLLLENKADPNKETPLAVAVVNEDVASAKALLEHGAEVDVMLGFGETPMTVAVSNRSLELVRLLLDHKADVNARAKNGLTPLHIAVRADNKEIMEILLAAKADVNATDLSGLTPLDYATPNRRMVSPGIQPSVAPNSFAARLSAITTAGAGSQPGSEQPSPVAELLRKAGASEWTPRPGQITLVRKSTGEVRVPFTQGTTLMNYHTLYEVIASGHTFGFPDFRKVTITRRDVKTGKITEIPVDVEALVAAGDCAKDPRLEWGDLVDLPEREHKLGENWPGLPGEFATTIRDCLKRQVIIQVRDQSRTNTLAPGFRTSSQDRDGKIVRADFGGAAFRLSHVVRDSGMLLTTSDLTRVRVRRPDAATGQLRAWTFDLERSAANYSLDLWLRDGDEITVPDK